MGRVGAVLASPTARAYLWLTGGSVVARGSILGILLASARVLPEGEFHRIAYLLAVATACQTLLDPGTANWLVSRWPRASAAQRRADWIVGMRLHACAMAGVVVLTATVSVASGHGVVLAGASLGVLSGCEGFVRAARASWQSQGRFGRYAAVDVLVAALRAGSAAVLVATHDLDLFALFNLGAALLLVVPVVRSIAKVHIAPYAAASWLSWKETLSEVWPFSTFVPSLYAQAPAVVIGLLGSVEAAAIYSVASRLTQPTELVPLAISNAGLPRLVAARAEVRGSLFRKQAAVAVGIAIAVAAVLLVGRSPLLSLFRSDTHDGRLTLGLLAVTLIPKYLSYQLVALCIADGAMRRRFVASVVVAVASLIATIAIAPRGATWVAAASLASELTLCVLLAWMSRRTLASRWTLGPSAWRLLLRRAPSGIHVAGFLVICAGAGILAGGIAPRHPEVVSLTFAVLVACVGLSVVGYVVTRDPLSPVVLLGLVLSVFFVMRPLYVLATERIGPTRLADDEPLAARTVSAMAGAQVVVLVAIGSLLLGYLAFSYLRPIARRAYATWGRLSGPAPLSALPRGFWVALWAAAGLELAVYGMLIRQAGGLSGYVSSLSDRSAVFLDRGYLAVAGVPLKVLALVLLASTLSSRNRSRRRWLAVTVAVSVVVVGDFLTGGRAALLIGTALPVALVVHWIRAPLRLRWILAAVLAGLLFFVAARVATRDAVYANSYGSSSGGSVLSITKEQLRTLPRSTLGGRDAVIFDSVTMLVRGRSDGLLDLQYGRTLLPIVTFPVPSAVWDGKPLGGGNSWFTQRLYPDFYGRDRGARTETSISIIGDLYGNFGLAGVALGCWLLGIAISVMYRRTIESQSLFAPVAYAITVGYLITLFRGDAFHSVTSWALTVALLVVTHAALRVARSERSVVWQRRVVTT